MFDRRTPRPLSVCALAALAALGAMAPAALSAGETKILIREDGVKVIMNEPSAAKQRRFADRLMPIPFTAMSEAIAVHATNRDLDPKLVRAVIQVESGYNVEALSNKGAMGLMQLMPGTAKLVGVSDPWDFDENIKGGTTYLKQQLDRFSDIELALAAYNAGPEAVQRHGGIPPYAETREYVRRILKLFDSDESDPASSDGDGRKVNIVRDGNNQIRITTASVGRQ
jgi:soluble lytic murein transglycosylase-like protein